MEIIELDYIGTFKKHAPLWNSLSNWITRKIGKVDYVYSGIQTAVVKDALGNYWDVWKDEDDRWVKHKSE